MKNKILIIILLLLLLSSCTTLKKVRSNNTTVKELIEKKKDSSIVIKTNGLIKDVIITKVDTIEDKKCDERLTEILNKLNTSKSSGSNNYKFYYDTKLRELRAEFEIAATESRDTNVKELDKREYSVIKEIEDYIKKVVTPFWAYMLLAFLFRKPLLSILKGILFIIFPASKGIKSISDLLTPPNKEDKN